MLCDYKYSPRNPSIFKVYTLFRTDFIFYMSQICNRIQIIISKKKQQVCAQYVRTHTDCTMFFTTWVFIIEPTVSKKGTLLVAEYVEIVMKFMCMCMHPYKNHFKSSCVGIFTHMYVCEIFFRQLYAKCFWRKCVLNYISPSALVISSPCM